MIIGAQPLNVFSAAIKKALGEDEQAEPAAAAKAKNIDAAYKWINFMLRPENAAEFTNAEKTGTAAKGSIELTNVDIRGNFQRFV